MFEKGKVTTGYLEELIIFKAFEGQYSACF